MESVRGGEQAEAVKMESVRGSNRKTKREADSRFKKKANE